VHMQQTAVSAVIQQCAYLVCQDHGDADALQGENVMIRDGFRYAPCGL